MVEIKPEYGPDATAPTDATPNWKVRAQEKVCSTLSKIPQEWRLSEEQLKLAQQTRQLTGEFFQTFLTEREIEITTLESVLLVDKIRSRCYSALEVTQAYAKAAAIAHQIVSLDPFVFTRKL